MQKHIAIVHLEWLLTFFSVCDNSLHVNKVYIGWPHCVSLHSYWPKSVRTIDVYNRLTDF